MTALAVLALLAAFVCYLAHALLRRPWVDRGTLPPGALARGSVGLPAIAVGAVVSVMGAQRIGGTFGVPDIVTGLFAIGLLCAAVLTALLLDGPGTAARVTAAVLCLLLLLHSRGIGHALQRPAVALPGLFGLVLLALTTAPDLAPERRPVLLALVLALAFATVTCS